MDKYNVFIIHGVGKQSEGYSSELVKHIRKYEKNKSVNFVEIVYSELLDDKIKSYTLNEASVKDVQLCELRYMFNETAFDAISYGYKKAKVLDYIKRIVDAHNTEGSKNTFIVHSLGGLVLYDFLTKFNFYADNVFTLGTPLALRLIGKQTKIRVGFWMNVVGTHDVIAKPLKTDFLNIQECDYDYVVPVGKIIVRKTPLCHVSYWTDDNVTKPIATKITLDLTGKFDRKKYFQYVNGLWKV